jgi:hypothetical protein
MDTHLNYKINNYFHGIFKGETMKLLVLLFAIILKTQTSIAQQAEEGIVVSRETATALANFISNNSFAQKWECYNITNGIESSILDNSDRNSHIDGVLGKLHHSVSWDKYYQSKLQFIGYVGPKATDLPPKLAQGEILEVTYEEFIITVNEEHDLIVNFVWSHKSKTFESMMTGNFLSPAFSVQNTKTTIMNSKICRLKQ